MTIRAAFSIGVDLAGADRLMLIHKVSLIMPLPRQLPGADRGRSRASTLRHARELVRRHLPGPGELLRATSRSSPRAVLQMYPEFELPPEQMKAWLADRTGAIVGADLAKRFGWKVGDRVPLRARSGSRSRDGTPWEFNIVGIYDGRSRASTRRSSSSTTTTSTRPAAAHGQGSGRLVRRQDRRSGAASAEIAQTFDAMFANSPAETKTTTEKAFVEGFAKQIGDIGAIMIAIAGVVLFMILLVAANTMAQSVRERTSELAVLKTLGFGDGRILALVLLESCAHRARRRRARACAVGVADRHAAAIRPAACCRSSSSRRAI